MTYFFTRRMTLISGFMWMLIIPLVDTLHSQEAALSWRSTIEKILRFEQPVDFSITPGICVGVYDAETSAVLMFGEPIGEDAIFELGSVTKPLMAWLVYEALDSLGLETSTPICHFIPDTLCTPDLARLTVAHLVQHRAGLSRLPEGIGMYESDVRDPYASYDLSDLTRDLLLAETVPGMYRYSHTGYAMLKWVMDPVGGLDDYSGKTFKRMLGLRQTGFLADSLLTPGHGMDGRLQPPWHTEALAGALGLRSSVRDLMRFIQITSNTLVRHLPVLTPGLKKKLGSWSRSEIYHVEWGWFVIPYGKVPVYYHNGRTGGHHVSVAFSPHLQKGVVVMSNGAMGSGDLSLSILRMLLRHR